jgi:hypothetical protein
MVHRLRPNVKPEKKALILKALTLQKNSSVHERRAGDDHH